MDFWNSLIGLGQGYLTGMSNEDVARINAKSTAATAKTSAQTWTMIGLIAGGVLLVIGLLVFLRRK